MGEIFNIFTNFYSQLEVHIKSHVLTHFNGRVEHKNWHVVEVGQSLLAHAKVLQSYWLFAFSETIYIINYHLTKCLQFKIPYVILTNKSPKFDSHKIFYALCYHLLRSYNALKLEYWSKECVYLGHNVHHKDYVCLNKQSGRFYVSSDVIFYESKFPFKDTSSQNSPNATQSLDLSFALPSYVLPMLSTFQYLPASFSTSQPNPSNFPQHILESSTYPNMTSPNNISPHDNS